MSATPDPSLVRLTRWGTCTLDADGCSSCGDVAVPVRVLALLGPDALALVEDRAGNRAEVAVDFVEGVRAGDVLLVHLGVAIGRVADALGEEAR